MTIPSSNSLRKDLTVETLQLGGTQESAGSTQNAWNFNLYPANKHLNNRENIPVPPILKLQYHGSAFWRVSSEDLQVALDALASLPSPEAERILAKPHINPFDGWIPLSTTALLVELRTAFAYAFRQDRNRGDLEDLALVIFSNTAQPFPDSQQYQSEDWYTSFSGSSLRWEIIGLLFSSWALGALQNKEDIDQYRPMVLASKFFDIMKSCIAFCRANKANNVLLLYLLYRTSIVSSILHASNSKAPNALSNFI